MEKICPVTDINRPRFAMSFLAGFAFLFVFDYIVHSMILMDTYSQTPHLWRAEEEMLSYFPWMLRTQFLTSFITAFIFTRHYEGKGIGEGVRFGLMLGALFAVMMSASFAWMPISLFLALAWAAAGLLQGLGLGVIFSLLYRK